MLDLLQKLVQEGCRILPDGRDAIVCREEPGHMPEDYAALRETDGGYLVLEGHRDKETLRAQAHGPEEGAALAAALSRRIFRSARGKGMAAWARACAEEGRVMDIELFLKRRFGNLCSLRMEDPCSISLVRHGGTFFVRYGGAYIAKDAPLPRAYAALCSHCLLLEEAKDFSGLVQHMGICVGSKDIDSLLVFGTQWPDRSRGGA